MKQLRSTGLLMLLATSMAGGAFAQESNGAPPEPENNRWIVQFEGAPSENEIDALISYTGGQTVKRLHLINGRAVRGPESMVAALRTSIMVKRVEKDVIRRATAQPSKPAPGEAIPWGVDRIDAENAWAKLPTPLPVVMVAVLDTGISRSHPDLKDNIDTKCSYNTIDPGKPPEDLNGHGSHVAGTIAAVHNSIGVVGVAPGAKLCAVQVLSASGWGYCSDIIEGLSWIIGEVTPGADSSKDQCLSPRAKVINMSYGGAECGGEMDALKKAHDCAEITLVAAAGNNSGGAVDYPAADPNVIAVTAINSSNGFASFSSQGDAVDLTAPGVAIPSTYKKAGYKTLSGTSMAAPHVSGVAALVLQNNSFTPTQVKERLQSTADCLTGLTKYQQGSGLVNAAKAVNADVTGACP